MQMPYKPPKPEMTRAQQTVVFFLLGVRIGRFDTYRWMRSEMGI